MKNLIESVTRVKQTNSCTNYLLNSFCIDQWSKMDVWFKPTANAKFRYCTNELFHKAVVNTLLNKQSVCTDTCLKQRTSRSAKIRR